MIGAIIGDIVGSSYEFRRVKVKTTDFELFPRDAKFTDDTVLTMAVANSILREEKIVESLKKFGNRYPHAGYGGRFANWLRTASSQPYYSFGNGSAMRVSPIGFIYDDVVKVNEEAKKSAECTHNHPEGIKGAQATAVAIFMAKDGYSKDGIKNVLESFFKYDLSRKLADIRLHYKFEVSCQKSVPEAIIAFLESDNFEDAIRKSISLGGDTDTQACITGGIAQAFYKNIPKNMVEEARKRLPEEFLDILDEFNEKYKVEF